MGVAVCPLYFFLTELMEKGYNFLGITTMN